MIVWFALFGWAMAAVAGIAWWRTKRRAQALLAAERRWISELLDRLEIAHWQRNLDTQALWWSPVFRRMHGVAPDEDPTLDNALRHVVEDDRASVGEALTRAYTVTGHGEAYYRIRQPDGQITHHLLRVVVTREPASGQRVAVGISLDISDRVRLESELQARSAYLEAIVRHLPMGLSVFDRSLKLRVWNDEFARVLDLPPALLREGTDFDTLIRVPAERGEYGEVDPDTAVAERRALALQFLPHRLERTRPNGRALLVIGQPVRNPNGEPIGFVTTYTDITEQKQERQRLAQAHDILRTLIDNIPAGVSMVDGDLRMVAWNEQLLQLLDLPRELFEQPGVTLTDILRYNVERGEYGPQDDPEAALEALRQRALRFEAHEFERTRPNGRVLHIRGQPLASGGFVTIYSDVTEQRAAQAVMQRLASTDALTGLTNRHALPAALQQVLASAQREGKPVALLFIDLDRFKDVNDSLGHAAGDAVLIEAARRLRAQLRSSDVIARIGGDEFVVALSAIRDAGDAGRLAAELVAVLSAPFEASDGATGVQRVYLTPSIGIAMSPRDGDDPAELLRRADIAMYHAKNAGGAGWRFFTAEMNQAAQGLLDVEARLRDAIAQDQLALAYQPIHALTEGLPLLGFEVLVRWPQSDGSVLPPAAFVPVAERSAELIEALSTWVCTAAARQRRQWRARQPAWPFLLSINLSARQFDRDGVAQRVVQAIRAADDDADREHLPLWGLEFEITEGVMMRDPQRAKHELEQLRALGARVAIDDFGIGYSSLVYLKHLPIDRIKIDRSFVADLPLGGDDAAIVRAAVALAHGLGIEAVAEGVETAAHLQALRAMGCNAIQGYGIARPMPADEVPAYLQRVANGGHLALWAPNQPIAATRASA